MVKIIEDNSLKYRVTCQHCKSILQFKSYDIKLNGKINCPACFSDVLLNKDGEILY
jgi:formylmethanofuran dehydrogenase subunit E